MLFCLLLLVAWVLMLQGWISIVLWVFLGFVFLGFDAIGGSVVADVELNASFVGVWFTGFRVLF